MVQKGWINSRFLLALIPHLLDTMLRNTNIINCTDRCLSKQVIVMHKYNDEIESLFTAKLTPSAALGHRLRARCETAKGRMCMVTFYLLFIQSVYDRDKIKVEM